jgi:hypothetical protein
MTEPLPTNDPAASLIGLGAQALIDNAKRLGLTWQLRLATVVDGISANQLLVKLDGDDTPITAVSMVGFVSTNRRVYVISVPPSGNFVVGWISGNFPQRVATTVRTTAGAGFTAETIQDSVTANLMANVNYRVVWEGKVQSTIADGYARMRLREDAVAGTQMQGVQQSTAFAASQSFPVLVTAEYLSPTNQTKTFVLTGFRQAGTGTLSCFADANNPTYLYVEYVNG